MAPLPVTTSSSGHGLAIFFNKSAEAAERAVPARSPCIRRRATRNALDNTLPCGAHPQHGLRASAHDKSRTRKIILTLLSEPQNVRCVFLFIFGTPRSPPTIHQERIPILRSGDPTMADDRHAHPNQYSQLPRNAQQLCAMCRRLSAQ